MAFIPLDTPLVPFVLPTSAAAAYRKDPAHKVLRVVVEILSALRNCPHHCSLGLALALWSSVCIADKVLRRGRIYRTDERILKLEVLIATKDEEKCGINDPS